MVRRSLLALAFLPLLPWACHDAPAVSQDTSYACDAATDPACMPQLADVEVLFTEPFCDRCSAADKEVLKARSPITAEVVELIDGAATSVDVAQFTFSVREIADALLRAHERGIAVRVAMDAGQDREGTRARELAEAGLNVRFVGGKPYGDRMGLQHAKFLVVDGHTILTGSNNFSSTGTTINEENTIVLRDAPTHPVTVGFRCHFGAIWAGDWENAGACSNEQALFTPSSAPFKLLRDELRSADRRIDVIMHHLTFDKLVKELTKAAERGVEVRVLLNETTREEHSGGVWDALVAAGGTLRYKRVEASTYQLLHHKVVVIDDRLVINGSGNWSGSGFFNNFENYVRWEHPRVVQPFRQQFHRLWTWSLGGDALDAGQEPATQHAVVAPLAFGNLHAHFDAVENGVALDDGEGTVLDGDEVIAAPSPAGVGPAAHHAFASAREAGLDFYTLSPHSRDDLDGEAEPNMTASGYAALRQAAAEASGDDFLALPGMEWSTNSTGNHVGIVGSGALAKVERGRFDQLYGDFLLRRELNGERPFVMLNHPRTFRVHEDHLTGNWDIIFGTNLLELPKAGDRNKKFNDYGLDDFAPLNEVRADWIAGDAMPDPAVVDATLQNLWAASSPYVRLMEVTVNRGKDLGSFAPENPSLMTREDGVVERFTKVHRDYDWFLTRGFHIAPVASHDNHHANWGYGHTSRTVAAVARLDETGLLDAIEHREVYASEDENLALRFFVEGRVPMGSLWASPATEVSATITLSDPDFEGPFVVRVFHGVVGRDGVNAIAELELNAGEHALTLPLEGEGEHFFYLEVHEAEIDRMAWTAPIWIEKL